MVERREIMSYTRWAWSREYTYGESNLYAYYDCNGKIFMNGHFFEREDIFEFVVSVLEHAEIQLTKEQMKKLAKEFNVKLRKDPLIFEEMFERINRNRKVKL